MLKQTEGRCPAKGHFIMQPVQWNILLQKQGSKFDLPGQCRCQEEQLWWRSRSSQLQPGGRSSGLQNTDWSLQIDKRRRETDSVTLSHYCCHQISSDIPQRGTFSDSSSFLEAQTSHLFFSDSSHTHDAHEPQLQKQKLNWTMKSWSVLTKVDVGLCDEPRLVVGVEGESISHQLFDRHCHSFHIHCLYAVPQIYATVDTFRRIAWEIFPRTNTPSYFGRVDGQMQRCSAVTSFTISSWVEKIDATVRECHFSH